MSKKKTPENTQTKTRQRSLFAGIAGLMAAALVIASATLMLQEPSEAADIVVYKSPSCGCCGKWVDHLQANGFSVEVKNQRDMRPVKQHFGIEGKLQSCHTGVVDGYLIEGHVPAEDIQRLLRERPAVRGLAVPGMPMGSPGMEGPRSQPYDVLAFDDDGKTSRYSSH